LHTCAALLAPAPHARLRLESLVAFERAKQQKPSITHRAFVEAALGFSLTTHEQLLGVQLLGSTALPGTQGGLRMEWGPVGSSCTNNGSNAAAAGNSGSSSTQGDVVDVTAGVSSMSISPAAAAAAAATAGSGTAGPPLSAVSLFLDLKPAYKRFVEAYAGAVAAASGLGGSSSSTGSSSSSRAIDWPSLGSPVTLVHLLAATVPSAAGPLVKALLRSVAAAVGGSSTSKGAAAAEAAAAAAGLFKWELTMHAAISTGSMKSCSQAMISTRPEYRLVAHSTQPHPMLLALSPKPLGLGAVQATQVGFEGPPGMPLGSEWGRKCLCLSPRACM
jgi:hypothetical protein